MSAPGRTEPLALLSLILYALLSHAEKLMLMALVLMSDNRTRRCRVSNARLAEYTALSVSTIERAKKSLLDRGVISWDSRFAPRSSKSSVSFYTLYPDAIRALPTCNAPLDGPHAAGGSAQEGEPGSGPSGLAPPHAGLPLAPSDGPRRLAASEAGTNSGSHGGLLSDVVEVVQCWQDTVCAPLRRKPRAPNAYFTRVKELLDSGRYTKDELIHTMHGAAEDGYVQGTKENAPKNGHRDLLWILADDGRIHRFMLAGLALPPLKQRTWVTPADLRALGEDAGAIAAANQEQVAALFARLAPSPLTTGIFRDKAGNIAATVPLRSAVGAERSSQSTAPALLSSEAVEAELRSLLCEAFPDPAEEGEELSAVPQGADEWAFPSEVPSGATAPGVGVLSGATARGVGGRDE